ncbi:MAG: antibiotic biosynthesis monooxygenase [Ignavibacteriales bacterium]|nr:antibiotic biosynthesis monooxygenase [Ignavibacteriales bacterium]
MFINTIEFPPIKAGKESEFLEWFKWSNSVYKKFTGFISRRLLQHTKGTGSYVILMEHENDKTFMNMHTSKEQKESFAKLKPLLEGSPSAKFYNVIIDNEQKKYYFNSRDFNKDI